MIVAVTSLSGLRQAGLPGAKNALAIELRLDLDGGWCEFTRKTREVVSLAKPANGYLIVTCRRPEEGGQWGGSEDQRREVLTLAAQQPGVDFIDVELGVDVAAPPEKIIRSWHDLTGMPRDLNAMAAKLETAGGAYFKLVPMAQSLCDNLRIRDFLNKRRGKFIAFCMGEYGVPSRILAELWGSAATYASFGEHVLAPGMLSVRDLNTTFAAARVEDRFPKDGYSPSAQSSARGFEPGTVPCMPAIYGITGLHVGHSLSPALHNEAIARFGAGALYLPLPARDVADFVQFARTLPLKGASVTVPFKEAIVPHCVALDDEARALSAVNTVTLDEKGSLRGANTDARGFIVDLEAQFGEVQPGCRFLVLGAGGAARAVAHALLKKGVCVGVYSRRFEQAKAACDGTAATPVAEISQGGPWECVVNCTPCGMRGEHLDEMPIAWHDLAPALHKNAVFYDLVYEPRLTPLCARAQAEGFHIAHGLGMLLRQGEAQAAIWGYLSPRSTFAAPVARGSKLSWLIGYRGSGKSTLAPVFAQQMNMPAFDLDRMLETHAGKPLAEIFRKSEAQFRVLEDIELSLLAAREKRGIVATGGGVILNARLIETMRETGRVIFLDAPEDLLVQRLRADKSRPSLTGKGAAEEVHEVMAKRRPLYEKAAHLRVEISANATPETLCQDIRQALQQNE
jgi:shikimate dehydrogenase/3-dehydroquinate dehydratase type I